MKLYLISGKARCGKNTVASIIENYYNEQGLKAIQTSYSKYIKLFAHEITGWNMQDEETKPRTLLQRIGTEVIREGLNKEYIFVNRMIEDIEIYENLVDVVIINDVRFPIEIDRIKEYYKNAVSINVKRINFENDLNEKERAHATETALDNYENFDYIIINDTLNKLKEDCLKLVEGIDKNE